MDLQAIQWKIYEIRDQNVMLDFDLAEMYEVETRTLKQAVRRNADRFPSDFMFELTREEYNALRSQFVILEENKGRGKHSKYNPFAFTEEGVAMLSSVLKSEKAINMNPNHALESVLMHERLRKSIHSADSSNHLHGDFSKSGLPQLMQWFTRFASFPLHKLG